MLYERAIEDPYQPNCPGCADSMFFALRDEAKDLELAKLEKNINDSKVKEEVQISR